MIKAKDFPTFSEDFLRQKSEPVMSIEEAQDLKRQLEDSFPDMGALGVACPQIGILKQASLIKFPNSKDFLFICNPEILSCEGQMTLPQEGCLSFPNKGKTTVRYKTVKVRYFDENLEEHLVVADDLESAVFQHEIDHLNGVLYKDHVLMPYRREEQKTGRNEKCPFCLEKGITVKYKKCTEHFNG